MWPLLLAITYISRWSLRSVDLSKHSLIRSTYNMQKAPDCTKIRSSKSSCCQKMKMPNNKRYSLHSLPEDEKPTAKSAKQPPSTQMICTKSWSCLFPLSPGHTERVRVRVSAARLRCAGQI